MADRKLVVEIVGDSSSLERAFNKSAKSAEGFGTAVRRGSLIAGAALGGGLLLAAKAGFAELAEGQQVAAQTEAVLKSTGGAAGVTAKGVDNLASSLSKMSGVDDEAIASGENLLLTFTNVRNEVGKGNDIFTQATKVMTDMSIALGQDMKSSSIQLGKALNDPIKGVTALQRVGVSFTKGQKDQIKALVESGRSMDAQKLILRELNKEFGGSAKAAGETMTGQLNKAKNAFSEMAASVTVVLLPALLTLAEGLTKVATFLTEHKTTAKALVAVLAALAGTLIAVGIATKTYAAAQAIIKGVTAAWTAAQWLLNAALNANPIGLIVIAIAALAAGLILAWKNSETFRKIVTRAFDAVKAAAKFVLDFFRNNWKVIAAVILAPFAPVILAVVGLVKVMRSLGISFGDVFDAAAGVVKAFWSVVEPIFEGIKTVIQGLIDFVVGIFTGDWDRAWKGVKEVVTGAFNAIKAYILAVPTLLLQALLVVGKAIIQGVWNGLQAAWPKLSSWFKELPGKVVALLADAGTWLLEKGKDVILGLLKGYVAVWGQVASWLAGLATKIPGALVGAGSWLIEKGKDIILGLSKGYLAAWVTVATWLGDLGGRILSAIGGFGSLLYNAGVSLIQGLISGITDKLGDLYDLVGGIGSKIAGLKGPVEKDRQLLVPQGKAIIEGLMSGMEDRLPDLTRMVSGIAPAIAGGLGSATGNLSAAAGSTFTSSTGSSVAMAGGDAGMAVDLHTHVYLDSTQIAEVIRREYLRFEKRNGRAAL